MADTRQVLKEHSVGAGQKDTVVLLVDLPQVQRSAPFGPLVDQVDGLCLFETAQNPFPRVISGELRKKERVWGFQQIWTY